MFKIESYVTPILLSYVDKYVRDFKPADAQVSLWGGGVALHNLVLKPDVLQKEVALPFTLVSGRIHELLIQVPWIKIMSEPIVVTIDTIECVLSINPISTPDDSPPPESPSRKTQVVEAPPGYMQALVRRIVSNIAVKVHHLIVKYVQDDIVLSLNVKHLAINSAGTDWKPSFADIDQNQPILRRLVQIDDLTLCLDRADSDGKIRFYQEPLLYRCHLDLRILTKLKSATSRRASSLSIELRSARLAWGVTSDQLILLLRLLRERHVVEKTQIPASKPSNINQATPLHCQSITDISDSSRGESWSEWAWSWLPSWTDRDFAVDTSPLPPAPIPVNFTAFLDTISFVYKVMEVEGGSRKRARSIIELCANFAAITCAVCAPTLLNMKGGARDIVLKSQGKCVCGHVDENAIIEESTIYLSTSAAENKKEDWHWPEVNFAYEQVDEAEVAEETDKAERTISREGIIDPHCEAQNVPTAAIVVEQKETKDTADDFWRQMNPLLFIEYSHERSPPTVNINPYENPPTDFEYSDWVEQSDIKIKLQLLDLRLCMGLIHRAFAIYDVLRELPPMHPADIGKRTLTVEECDALLENLPQRRIEFEFNNLRLRIHPWNHALNEKPMQTNVVLDLKFPKSDVVINCPLYPQRVCSAACQIPDQTSPIWNCARVHITAVSEALEAQICSLYKEQPKPCARVDVQFVTHILLNQMLFTERHTILYNYSMKISEVNISGSSARLQCAFQILLSFITQRKSVPLRLTTLAKDGLNDEDAVALDITIEDFLLRGYITSKIKTHILTMQSARATVFHRESETELKQAWVFSAPDVSTITPYLRVAGQWCSEKFQGSLNYFGIWTEPTAICIDPLFMGWLAYRPFLISCSDSSQSLQLSKSISSTQYLVRRRVTPSSSSGRGHSQGELNAEQVHVRPRSIDSSSEHSELKNPKHQPHTPKLPKIWWQDSEKLLKFHDSLRDLLLTAELGLVLVYVTTTTASAVDCPTIRIAMEDHANAGQNVLALSVGRWSMHSTATTKNLWRDIKHDGPTFVAESRGSTESFPWKMRLADVSCYTLEVRALDRSSRERSVGGLRSQLKVTHNVNPCTVVELFSTTVTLSVVTKTMHYKTFKKKAEPKAKHTETKKEAKTKYFTTGSDFKPTTLKEFVRGPDVNKKDKTAAAPDQSERESEPGVESDLRSGPIVSFGIHLHADTPPIIIRLDQEQVYIVGSTIHCITHLLSIIGRSPMVTTKKSAAYSTMVLGPRKSIVTRSSEVDEIESISESDSDHQSDLISIFEAHPDPETMKMKTFFWFQWVISRITVVIANYKVKLALEIDDIINTVDLQQHYNQLRIKISSASVKHFEKTESGEWAAGILGGRVLEVREPMHAQEDTHFLSVTITQAQISNLPESWKEELHPKVLEQKNITDSTWEIFATLAPLEAIVQPTVLKNIIALAQELAPRSSCSLRTEAARKPIRQWPFCYINAGGLRLLVTCKDLEEAMDDTFMISLGRLSVNPHPDNPVCRKPINAVESATNVGYYGRQYELIIENFSIKSAQFQQIVNQEISESEVLTAENPACKWNQAIPSPVITPVLHAIDIGCVVAPPVYTNSVLICGPGLELNLMSDCTIELSVEQIQLIRRLVDDLRYSSQDQEVSSSMYIRAPCDFASALINAPCSENFSNISFVPEDDLKAPSVKNQYQTDSGVDTVASQMSMKSENYKKSFSVAFAETSSPYEHLEVFVTMGVIEVTLFSSDDDTPQATTFKSPKQAPVKTPTTQVNIVEESTEPMKNTKQTDESPATSNIIEISRAADVATIDLTTGPHSHVKRPEKITILQVRLQQPNLYYWRKRGVRNMQVSIFNLLISLGAAPLAAENDLVLLTTAQGLPDPDTGIPPALVTMKFRSAAAGSLMVCGGNITSHGNLRIDVERPLLFEVSTNILKRIKIITNLLQDKTIENNNPKIQRLDEPLLYKLRTFMAGIGIDSVTIQTSQIGVRGSEGTAGWASSSLQLAEAVRPDRLVLRAMIAALLVSTGSPQDEHQPMLHPLQLGLHSEIIWEAWRRVESGLSPQEPIIYMCIDLDRINLDVRPTDIISINNLKTNLMEILCTEQPSSASTSPSDSSVEISTHETQHVSAVSFARTPYFSPSLEKEMRRESKIGAGNHYYKDDLRSGAFKIVSGGQLPMAYQVMLNENTVSWRYPHPRAINRLVAFPLPGHDSEIQCVLELYHQLLGQWEPHTYFCLPVDEPREIEFHVSPPEAVFGVMWRYRVCSDIKQKRKPFEFDMYKFLPRADPLAPDVTEPEEMQSVPQVSAQELSGVLRVDSYFAPCLLPRVRLTVRMASLDVHIHNSLPSFTRSTLFEGYYVSKPLMRSHRLLTISAQDTTAFSDFGSPAGMLLLISSELSSDILDCATGAMEQLIPEFRAHVGVGIPDYKLNKARLRLLTTNINMALHVPRLLTLKALVTDWRNSIKKHTFESSSNETEDEREKINRASVPTVLEGRVSLWIHNSCSSPLRIGQEGTDENLPLGAGVKMAYRWRSPTAEKKMRFASASPSTDWHWSNSIPFTVGTDHVQLENIEVLDSETKLGVGGPAGANVYVRVEESGTKRNMRLSGRLTLANMLRFGLFYKIRMRPSGSDTWSSVSSGVLEPESVGLSVICTSQCDMVLKIKFADQETGWSGDIPLKECPKENVPWLVKVPSEGELPYVSVWCRVVCARSDGRILAAVWPFYVLRSHLPLDTDVLVATDTGLTNTEDTSPPPPRILAASGRGATTQLLVPGTTSARHTLSFQYRNIDCPVTREAAPLHYGVTDSSVFEKQTPILCLEDVLNDVETWLEKSNRHADSSWPYSLVTKHWPGSWQPAFLQPRCDVIIRYQPVHAGGGCSLEVHLTPLLLLCNASTIALTLRAYDATPLCKLEPGSAIAPPSVILTKPFFISIEMGRETFVSGQLQISTTEPGRYGALLPGQIAVDHASAFAIQCNQEVALLTMYYEIKENINILGISSSYILYNRLNIDILVSATAVPIDNPTVSLHPKNFQVLCGSKDKNPEGMPLCRFWLRNRWHGDSPAQLHTYLSLALPTPLDSQPSQPPVPVRLAQTASRRAVTLADVDYNSVPVVVTQHQHENRWIITVASDPCPQFILHNHTHYNLAVAVPKAVGEEPSGSITKAHLDCPGVRWCFNIGPGVVKHYTTPTLCTRHPNPSDVTMPITFLVLGEYLVDDIEPDWSAPVAIAEGEQFLQLHRTGTLKMRVHIYPHSSLIELRDVDQNDISASEIRKRLLYPFTSDKSMKKIKPTSNLERVGADDKLLTRTYSETTANKDDLNSEKQTVVQTHSTMSLDKLQKSITTTFTPSKVSNKDDEQSKTEQAVAKTNEEKDSIASSVFVAIDKEQPYSSNIPPQATEAPNSLQRKESADNTTTKSYNLKPDPVKSEVLKSAESVLSLARASGELSSLTLRHGLANAENYPLGTERFRCVVAGIAIQTAVAGDAMPLLAFHADRAALLLCTQGEKIITTLTIADVQIDNLQYDSGQYDFAVVATTRAEPLESEQWPAFWNMFADHAVFTSQQSNARVVVTTCHDRWKVVNHEYNELTEVHLKLGPLALYIEDAYVTALTEIYRLAVPHNTASVHDLGLAQAKLLQCPLRFRALCINSLDLTLTLHTAMRMYIALDQSPLHLRAFRLQNVMTSLEQLVHALTVHYLSATILGAGWVVGGLELLGAPGALASRVGGATGGVRGIASATAAAFVRSLSALAGSLARNLDLLVGDEEHARRAAAARRRPPDSLVAGLTAGVTNFAINILGAVGGLAHHPLVSVAVGETESGAAALRRGLIGAVAKPLSATADLVAFAGHGLLRQTGWDPVPNPRPSWVQEKLTTSSWRRDCVRWAFRLAEMNTLSGFEVQLNNASLLLLLTHKFLVVADPETETVVEMIDLRFCSLKPFKGENIELCVTHMRNKNTESRADEDDEYQVNAATMARVARYTGTEGADTSAETRILTFMARPGQSHALYAALEAAIHYNSESYFSLL